MRKWGGDHRIERSIVRGRRCIAWSVLLVAGLAFPAGAADRATPARHAAVAEAREFERNGQYAEAVPRYRKLLRQFPSSDEVRMGLADNLARGGKCEEVDSPGSPSPAAPLARARQGGLL